MTQPGANGTRPTPGTRQSTTRDATVTATKAAADDGMSIEAVLRCDDPERKAHQAIECFARWQALPAAQQAAWLQAHDSEAVDVDALVFPGRPDHPELVVAAQVPRRGFGTEAGRVALLHSLAHIEFNAINLALDAVFRFREQPLDYVTDWLSVAADEGEHFLLLQARLRALGSSYGQMAAHDGLWDMARRTRHDVLVRMALVPRLLEARGLDVAPPMIEKLVASGDHDSAAILQRIYQDEIRHVDVGNRWFRALCAARKLDGIEVFRDLLKGPNSAFLRSPFNDAARLEAGFTTAEMQLIRQMEQEYRAGLVK